MRRPIIFVLLAGVAALLAALVVYSALKKREFELRQATAQNVEIVVAAHDLTIGTKLDPAAVKLARWSRDSLPPGAFTSVGAVMNQYTKSGFVENEPIVADRLFNGDKDAGVMPMLIPPGMRAISVPVDEVSDVAGFVLPHAHVDVLVALQDNGTPGNQPFSKIVLQDVEVLAVAQQIEKINDKPQVVKVVTLLVTPQQAERVALASREGSLRLAMRNYDDKEIVETNGVDVQQLLHAYSEAATALPVSPVQHPTVRVRPRRLPPPVKVEVMRNGCTAESITFVRSGGAMTPAPPEQTPAATSDTARPEKISSAFGPAAAIKANVSLSSSDSRGLAAVNTGGGTVGRPMAVFDGPHARTIDIP
ncbi:MAG: Flp pilus assembly protein CpaB [Candidatus Binataceae bacterium]